MLNCDISFRKKEIAKNSAKPADGRNKITKTCHFFLN